MQPWIADNGNSQDNFFFKKRKFLIYGIFCILTVLYIVYMAQDNFSSLSAVQACQKFGQPYFSLSDYPAVIAICQNLKNHSLDTTCFHSVHCICICTSVFYLNLSQSFSQIAATSLCHE